MLTTLVNTDVKMPKRMLAALSLFETFHVVQNIDTTTEEKAREWLRERYGDKMAQSFKPEYLYPTPSNATATKPPPVTKRGVKSITIKFNKSQTDGEVVFSKALMHEENRYLFIAAIQDAIMLLQSELLTAESEIDDE